MSNMQGKRKAAEAGRDDHVLVNQHKRSCQQAQSVDGSGGGADVQSGAEDNGSTVTSQVQGSTAYDVIMGHSTIDDNNSVGPIADSNSLHNINSADFSTVDEVTDRMSSSPTTTVPFPDNGDQRIPEAVAYVATSAVSMKDDQANDNSIQAIRKSPPVWAKNRGALCEGTPYFKSHDSGNYHSDKITHGLLLDSVSSARDYIDGTVIITTIGGGKSTDAATGQRTRTVDQTESSENYIFLTNSKEGGYSVVVVVGNKNEKVRPPHPYCVLGEYQVTDIWMEKFPDTNNRKISYWMVRLEKLEVSETSWFVKPGDLSHTFDFGQHACPSLQCHECHEYSKQIYDKGWTCLNHKCSKHFHFMVIIEGQMNWESFTSEQVEYSVDFLRERTDCRDSINHRQALIPKLPTMGDHTNFGTEAEFKQGIVCPVCHCASRRVHWSEWKCEGGDCDFTYKLETRVYPLSEVAKESKAVKRYGKLKYDKDLVTHWDTTIAGYEVQVFTLPDENGDICGTVLVYRATEEICAKSNGPDDLFLTMQDQNIDLKLKRNVVRQPGTRYEKLCSHFASNWGAPYKFGVFVDTTAFADAPEPILRSVSQLTWAQKEAIVATKERFLQDGTRCSAESMSLKSETFNELLSLGYFESSKISYHDDGEKELGPTVATLSLGSPSVMRFRPKTKNRIGTAGSNKKRDKNPVISFPLYHGDICIMHGVDVHKFYDHEVTPRGKLRFAMTSRYIRPETMPTPEAQEKCKAMGVIPEGFENLAYKGIDPSPTAQDTNGAESLIVTFPLSQITLAKLNHNAHNNNTALKTAAYQ
ncbi:hypothetical protein SCUP234_02868 [Seiridium cupressi]